MVLSFGALRFCCCGFCGRALVCCCTSTILDQKRISMAEQPNSVAMLKRNIQVIAAGCTCISASPLTPPKIIPKPPVMVNPITIVGTVSLTGATIGAGGMVSITDRLAPHLLQYLTSTVISLPQLGQYIMPPV